VNTCIRFARGLIGGVDVFSSTPKAGFRPDVQATLAGIHSVSLPWRPRTRKLLRFAPPRKGGTLVVIMDGRTSPILRTVQKAGHPHA